MEGDHTQKAPTDRQAAHRGQSLSPSCPPGPHDHPAFPTPDLPRSSCPEWAVLLGVSCSRSLLLPKQSVDFIRRARGGEEANICVHRECASLEALRMCVVEGGGGEGDGHDTLEEVC